MVLDELDAIKLYYFINS